jgi:hypothetical protein
MPRVGFETTIPVFERAKMVLNCLHICLIQVLKNRDYIIVLLIDLRMQNKVCFVHRIKLSVCSKKKKAGEKFSL